MTPVLAGVPLLAFLLTLRQFVRRTCEPGLRIFTLAWGLLAVVMLSSFVTPSSEAGAALTVLLRNAAALAFAFLLLVFLIAADEGTDPAHSHRATRRELAVVLTVAAAMTACFLMTPSPLRGSSTYLSPGPAATGTVFYLLGNAYLTYAPATSAWLAVQHARRSDRRVATGLRVAAAGLASIAVAGGARVLSLLARSAGYPGAPAIEAAQLLCLQVGLPLLVAGMTLPGIVIRGLALRRWAWHVLVHRRLTPLRTALTEALPPTPLPVRRNAFGAVLRRSCIRVIECRDGLLRIGPHLAAHGVPDGVDDPAVVADVLHEAVRDCRARRPTDAEAIRVLPPCGTGLEADVAQLVVLSRALEAAARSGAPR